MRVYHSIRINRKPQLCAELAKLGVSIEPRSGAESFVAEVDDSDPRWPEIYNLARACSAWIIDCVTYSNADIESADWLLAHAVGDVGYPQPSGDNGYLRETFNLENHCPRCGIGRIQRGPYRLSSEPKAKTIHFFAPQWDHQTIFARHQVRCVFEDNKLSGLAFTPIVKHRSGSPLESIIQLMPTAVLPAGLCVTGQKTVTCKPDNEEVLPIRNTPRDPRVSEETSQAIETVVGNWPRTFTPQTPYCGRVKYQIPYSRRVVQYRASVFIGAPDFVLSSELFGSGGHSDRQIVVSKKVANIVREQKWKGLRLEPIQLLSE